MAKTKEPRRAWENRIWIELDAPPKEMKDAELRKAFREEQAKLANNMMRRLSVIDPENPNGQLACFWWASETAATATGTPGATSRCATAGTGSSWTGWAAT